MDPTSANAVTDRGAIRGMRAAFGGALMGFANLVPGISGGTMLLAAGVYTDFITAVADVTTFRFTRRGLALLGAIGGAAALVILLLAGPVKDLVVDHRWVMYSLFVGLTLGGVPLVWRLAAPATPSVFWGAGFGFALMLLMVAGIDGRGTGAGSNYVLLTVAGLAGASAMILPGVSGGYLLLLLGQYEVILGAIDQVKVGLLGDATAGVGPDMGLALQALHVVIPVGIGVVAGVAGVSNLIRWLLKRFEKATLGALLGLLVGAVVGLWPFQRRVEPLPGHVVDGVTLSASDIAALSPESWPMEFFGPGGGQILAAVLLVGIGLAATLTIDRLGGQRGRIASDRPVGAG